MYNLKKAVIVNEMFINRAIDRFGQTIIFYIFVSNKLKPLNIKDYIKELLYTNQGVIIPGLGGFVTEYEPAAFDVNENKFLPPSKKVIFNTKYSFQDTLLIDLISKKESINKEKAKNLLDDFVKETTAKLKKGEIIDFQEIGTLSQNNKGDILFTQNKNLNLLTDSFGLKSVKAKAIAKQQEKQIVPIKKKSYKKSIIIGSSAIIFICLVALSWTLTDGFSDFGFISFNENTTTEKQINIGIINTEKNLDSIAKADSIKALINETIDETTDKKDALFYKEPNKEVTQISKPQYSKFYIIAGSFKRMANAETFANQLKKKGYNTEIIQSGEELFRISIETFSDETSALKELYRLRDKGEIKSVWILKSN